MKRTVSIFISVAAVALFLAACSWNPSVKEVPITAPWDKMNLPIKESARVWGSDDKELKVVHKASRAEVAKSYFDALEKDGWKFTANPVSDENMIINEYEKGGQQIRIDVYDFENTGVIIRKK
jgi:hypothetical protein